MDLARFLGILVVFGVPAIIGGGLVYHLFHSWIVVWIFEAILVFVAFKTAYAAAGKAPAGGHGHDDHGHEHAH
jgi:hypothetical protein